MSIEEYHARQRANEAQDQARKAAIRNAETRRHLERALELLDPEANSEAYQEIEKALKTLS